MGNGLGLEKISMNSCLVTWIEMEIIYMYNKYPC